jgi:hypothetical protein
MDHSEAVRLNAAEKYVLGDLHGTIRDEYEEHYFDCAECAADLKATAAFVSLSRIAFEDRTPVDRAPAEPSWIKRFRLAIAVPTFAAAALAIVVAYQSSVTIPSLERSASLSAANAYTQTIQMAATAVRGRGESSAGDTPFVIDPKQGSSIRFDFTPSEASLRAYVCQLKDPSGRVVLQQAVPVSAVNQAFGLAVPGGVMTSAGKYQVVFLGADPATGQPSAGPAVMSFPITIAFRQ